MAPRDPYFPAEYRRVISLPWIPENGRRLAARHWHYRLLDEPLRSDPRPGRNAPCSCGSGKKYTRCCGA